MRFGTELTALRTGSVGVRAELLDSVTGRRLQVKARYLIGADGPYSKVRDELGIAVEDLGSIGDFMSVTFRADLTARLGRTPSALNAVMVDGAEGLFVPTSADDRWIFAREWHPDAGETMADWSPARIIAMLRAGTGLPDLQADVESVMPFEMAGHVAVVFRSGPAFLVGDAAHRTTPVGGTGMNTAIAGAHNLGWKMAWVLRGWADDSLLDSYELERRPVGEANVRVLTRPRAAASCRRTGLGHRSALRVARDRVRRWGGRPRTARGGAASGPRTGFHPRPLRRTVDRDHRSIRPCLAASRCGVGRRRPPHRRADGRPRPVGRRLDRSVQRHSDLALPAR